MGPESGHGSPDGAVSRSLSPSDLGSSADSLAGPEHEDALEPPDSRLAEDIGAQFAEEGPSEEDLHPAATIRPGGPDGLAAGMRRPSTPEPELGTVAIFDQDSADTLRTHSEVRSAPLSRFLKRMIGRE